MGIEMTEDQTKKRFADEIAAMKRFERRTRNGRQEMERSHREGMPSRIAPKPSEPERVRREAAWKQRLDKWTSLLPLERGAAVRAGAERVASAAHASSVPSHVGLLAMFSALERRGIYDFGPYILHAFGKGPDPDKPVRPRRYRNPWTAENT
jgi:hypothetical protein